MPSETFPVGGGLPLLEDEDAADSEEEKIEQEESEMEDKEIKKEEIKKEEVKDNSIDELPNTNIIVQPPQPLRIKLKMAARLPQTKTEKDDGEGLPTSVTAADVKPRK